MKIKKLLAGLLSLAMIASSVPVALAGTTATVPKPDGYEFFETFEETDFYKNFSVYGGNGRWDTSVDEGYQNGGENRIGTKALRYYVKTKNPSKKHASIVGNGTTLVRLTGDKVYEIGYKLDLHNLNKVQLADLSVTFGEGGGPFIKSDKGGNPYLSINGEDIQINSAIPIEIVIYGKPAAGRRDVFVTYTDMKGELVEDEYYAVTSTTGNKVLLNAAEIDSSQKTEGEFFIDDVYVKERDTASEYKLTFKDGESTILAEDYTTRGIYTLSDVAEAAQTAKEDGYTLIGWTTEPDGEKVYEVDERIPPVSEDTTLYAVWQEETYVTFEYDGVIYKEGYTYFGKITPPTVDEQPDLPGKKFAGWLWDGEKVNDDTEYTGERVTVLADMVNIYTVNFWKDKEMTKLHDTKIGGTNAIEMPSLPTDTEAGYFDGWYYILNGVEKPFNRNSYFDSDIDVYAKWSEYLYYEDFNDPNDYDHTWDTPAVEEGVAKRWTNEIDEDGAMRYTTNGAGIVDGKNVYPFGMKDFGDSLPIDPNSMYELTYKIDLWPNRELTVNELLSETKPMGIRVTAGNTYEIGGVILGDGGHQQTTVSIGGGSYTDFLHSDLSNYNEETGRYPGGGANRSQGIDGYLNVRVRFRLNDHKYEMVVEYKRTDGVTFRQVNHFQYSGMPAQDFNGTAYIRSIIEYKDKGSATPNGGGFKIDDIRIRRVDNYPVTFDYNYDYSYSADGETYTPTDTAAEPEAMLRHTDYDGVVVVPTKEETMQGVSDRKRDGWEFDGWYADEDCTVPFDASNVFGPSEAYAKWVKVHKVKLHYFNETKVSETTTANLLTIPVPDVLEGYQFRGWFTEENGKGERIADEQIKVIKDIDLYGYWLEGTPITFDPAGGSVASTLDYVVAGETPVYIQTPVLEGYRFDGWFLSDGTEFNTSYVVTEPITVTARWSKMYKIEFNLGIGRWETEPETIYSLDKIDLSKIPTPVVDDGRFDHWSTEDGKVWDGSVPTVIPDPANCTIKIFAQYDNLIFWEDFETTDGLDYLKTLAPLKWEQYLADGAGVITERDGNKVFRVANEANKRIYLDLDSTGEGLYEIGYKIKHTAIVRTGNYQFGTPAHLNENGSYTNYPGTSIAGGQRIDVGYTGGSQNNGVFSAEDCPDGYVDIVSLYDTENELTRVKFSYISVSGKEVTVDSGYLPCSYIGKIDAIAFVYPNASDQLVDAYIDDLYVRKIAKPTVVNMTPQNGDDNIAVNGAKIEVEFDRAMNANTLNSTNFYVADAEGNKPAQKITTSENSDGYTIATITFTEPLKYSSDYTVTITNNVTDSSYQLDKTYKTSFTTEPEKYNVEYSALDRNGNAVTSIANYKGEELTATISLENYNGDSPQKYFAAIAVVDTVTGKQWAYNCQSSEIALGAEETLVTLTFTVPGDISNNCVFKYFVWDTCSNKSVLANAATRP